MRRIGSRGSRTAVAARARWTVLALVALLVASSAAAQALAQELDTIEPGSAADIEKLARLGGAPDKLAFKSPVTDFYMTNPIARASAVMAECSQLAQARLLTAAE